MIASFLIGLLELNIAASAAIVFVLLVRSPAHRLFGPRAVYLLWALVPAAMLATLIPARVVEVTPQDYDRIVVTSTVIYGAWEIAGLALLYTAWIGGAAILARVMIHRQARFGAEEDRGAAGPAVVGFCYPRVVTPKNFAERFTWDERRLILTHEGIHIERCDSRINGVIALVRCLCWFNPLIHIGASALSADQELSCDATVVERRPRTRRIYAETLIKTQVAEGPLPIGCYWPGHPLKERIAQLARKPLSHRRTVLASIAAALLAMSGGVAAWAAQPERPVLARGHDLFIPISPFNPAHPPADSAPIRADTEPAP
jgi:beta-lactamase regulating signal transducer with metallopeptidase domain